LNFYKHHIGDYAQATAHLSFVEDAAYSRCLRKYYAEEAPLPAELKAVQRLVGARTKEEREAVQTVLEEFFELREDGWHNKRADAELAKANAQAETNRQIALDREAKRKEREAAKSSNDKSTNRADQRHESSNESLHESSASREPSQTPDTRHQTPDTTTSEGIPSNLTVAPAPPPDERPVLALVGAPEQPEGPPACPHQAVLALWAEVLPQLPQHLPSQWKGARADHLRARWRETAVEKGWTTQEQGLTYLRRLFGYVAQSEFLSGRSRPQPGKRPFVIELEWLVNPTNWAKVHEGKYHGEAA
jgi:uncharacterized protein YdaU (DUF1376 family)